MAVFDIVTPKGALAQILREQIASLGDVRVWDDACAALAAVGPGSFLLWDASVDGTGLVPLLSLDSGRAVVFWLGDPPDFPHADRIDAVFPLPLRLGLLLSRIPLYLHRQKRTGDTEWIWGDVVFLPDGHVLMHQPSGRAVRLTDKESALLDVLIRADAVVRKDRLLSDVWGYDDGIDTHTLETHIYRLRRKFAELLLPEDPEGDAGWIDGVDGGYVFCPPCSAVLRPASQGEI